MNEKQAIVVAGVLGGEAWQSGGDIWLVLIERPDGKYVVISDEAACEYASRAAFDDGAPEEKAIHFC